MVLLASISRVRLLPIGFQEEVIRQLIPKLNAGNALTPLIRRGALLTLNLSLHVVDEVVCLDTQGEGHAGQSLHKDLHTFAQPQRQVQGGLFLEVVI
jgi:hypothetical protein